jgi:hypothetical protein
LNLRLDYYTLEQASRRLETHADELMHFIEIEKLPIHYLSEGKDFVITKDRQGLGVSKYKGLFRINGGKLINSEKDCLDLSFLVAEVELLNPEALDGWNTKLPIDAATYIRESEMRIDGWSPTNWEEVKQFKRVYGVPFPTLEPEHWQETHRSERLKTLKEQPDLDIPLHDYCWDGNLCFGKGEIRITHKDLMDLKTAFDTPGDNTPVNLNQSLNRSRTSQLIELLHKILLAHPDKKSTEIWGLLRSESNKVNREFDLDEILLAVTAEEIIWESTYEKKQILKRSSFSATLSRLRRQMNAN